MALVAPLRKSKVLMTICFEKPPWIGNREHNILYSVHCIVIFVRYKVQYYCCVFYYCVYIVFIISCTVFNSVILRLSITQKLNEIKKKKIKKSDYTIGFSMKMHYKSIVWNTVRMASIAAPELFSNSFNFWNNSFRKFIFAPSFRAWKTILVHEGVVK